MNRFLVLVFCSLISIYSKAQAEVVFLDDLIEKSHFGDLNTYSRSKIAYILTQQSDIVMGKRAVSNNAFDLIFFDGDSLFVEFLKNKTECYLISFEVLKKSQTVMQAEITLSTTNFQSYTNPNGQILGLVSSAKVLLENKKQKCVWQYVKTIK